jgi:polyisoprenoid-binding protein YceI
MRVVGLAALAAFLAGCTGQIRESLPKGAPQPGSQAAVREGQPYSVVPAESLLTILVYRGGTLARMGHNHVVASHDLEGVAYAPDDLTRTSFEVHIPVSKLTVDEPELREAAGTDFPPGVPDSAKEGTRNNMLSAALLDAEHFPEILLRSQSVDVVGPNELLLHVQVTAKDQTSAVTVPAHYELTAGSLEATGEFPLKHSDLGLTPFSVMLGAMQVQDEMKVRFKLHFTPVSPQIMR